MELSPASVAAIFLAGGATFAGALPVLFLRRISDRLTTALLGFGGGVMLAATAFSLLIPGIEAATQSYGAKPLVALVMLLGISSGSVLLSLVHQYAPHEHFIKGVDGGKAGRLARVWLFIIAIALHNFPEGLAVGVSFGSENVQTGMITALGIGLQNFPEGLIVAMSLVAEGYTVGYALWVSFLTATIEPVASFIGLGVVSVARASLPWALTFAAGAMLFVICDEIIPESNRRGRENEGTIGIIAGFTLLVVLTILFGE
ncbi:putative divalent heavy-metal cations transporter [Nostoc sp. PCC 7524]|uniref:ZIP family metal transporter n=1 Tax=Nostoc sp. (strain ATCC 29411 / PCC 7524) TaxID=28072 RepID=UPI00029F24B2|nr:ZIP family metal transporter [Nostoc sp. PCC 7524]AFY47412.1 putative divalent heavy-metal cations transporter [Nostoc sp. PCC 7524]